MSHISNSVAALIVLSGLVSGCVTINVYFPAAAAEKAADKVIDEVWQLRKSDSQKNKATPDSSDSSSKETK